jgi:hypothetical protein
MATFNNDVISTNLLTAIGGVAPSAGDEVVLRQYDIDYTAGLTFANDLLLMHLRPEWKGSIPTTDLIFTANRTGAGKVIVEWSGRLVRMASAAAANVWGTLDWNPVGGGTGLISTVTPTLTFCRSGTLIFADTVIPGTVRVFGGQMELRESASNTFTSLICSGGVTKIQRDGTTFEVNGTGLAEIDSTAFSPANTYIRGGTARYRNAGASGGNLYAYAGVIDFTGCASAITFGGGELHPGATILKRKNVSIDLSACTDYGAKIIQN